MDNDEWSDSVAQAVQTPSLKTKQMIAQAAAREFVNQGYAATSLSSIAAVIGLTKGALSYHFRNKRDFAEYFLTTLKTATRKADEFSREQFPDDGAQRLILYFFILSQWALTHIELQAGMKVLTDRGVPTSKLQQSIIDCWMRLSTDALSVLETKDGKLSDAEISESSELFLLSNVGAAVLRSHMGIKSPRMAPLEVACFVLTKLGALNVSEYRRHIEETYANTQLKLTEGMLPVAASL